MPSTYTEVRRAYRDVDPERDLKRLWSTERFEDAAAAKEALRITETAIRAAGWDAVKVWARAAIASDSILHGHLTELAMRALEQKDEVFLAEITAALLSRSPASYFRLWLTLFSTSHSHRGERIFRGELERIDDYRIVKYRRWVRRIFRKLRFRCRTPREKAIGAVAFSMLKELEKGEHRSEVFDAFAAAHDAARTWPKTKLEKPVPPAKQAERFAPVAAQLGIWSVVEGIRTSAKIPRTLGYLSAMLPRMTDLEVRRSLRAFDAKLKTADHKKASEEVTACARALEARLERMDVPIEEWAKVLPYLESAVLKRAIETILGARVDAWIAAWREGFPFTAVPVVDTALGARAFRAAYLVGYGAHRAADAPVYSIDAGRNVRALDHASLLWPYGVGGEPPAQRWEAEPDVPHRAGLDDIRLLFPLVASQAASQARPIDATVRALRAYLYRAAVLEGRASERAVPIVLLPSEPTDDERAALSAILACFPAAIVALVEARWERPLAIDHVLSIELPATVEGMTRALLGHRADLERAALAFAARKPAIDREVRSLRLSPPAVIPVLRAPLRS